MRFHARPKQIKPSPEKIKPSPEFLIQKQRQETLHGDTIGKEVTA